MKKGKKGSGDHSVTVEQIATDLLVPYAKNARTHSEEQVSQIAGSIQEFGFCNPVLIDGENGIIAGHGRVLAAQKLQLETVPCIRLGHLTDAQKRAYILADNRIAQNSGWDLDLLANELSDLHADEFDLALLGFDAEELTDLLKLDEAGSKSAGEIIEDEVPEPPADPITKPGELWILGEHRLLCGDSTKAEDVGRLMAGAKADLCFTSPPYNAGNSKTGAYGGGSAKRSDFKKMYTHDLDDMTSDQYKQFLFAVLDLIAANTKDSACVLWNVAYNATSRREFGEIAFGHQTLKVQETIVWDKTIGMNVCANNIYSRSAEFVFLLSKSEKYKSNQSGGVYWNIWRISTRDGDNMQNGHGASFPVKLPAKGIEQHSVAGDNVYEPFCGSGTTLIAAEQLGRKCYGMEISPAYCDVIVKRWENLTGKKAVLEAA